MGKASTVKEPKDPEADYRDSLYTLDGGQPGFPAVAFKAAIADAARYFQGVTITQLKQALYVHGLGLQQLVPIEGKPEVFEMPVRLSGQGKADIRFRPIFMEWSAVLIIDYVEHLLTEESLLALVDAAGYGGVGEWRPSSPNSKTGQYGTFRVHEEAMP
jgi:hypothetical protein